MPGRVVCIAACAAGLLAACSSTAPEHVVTVTRAPSVPPATQPTPTTSASTSAAATPTPTAGHMTQFDGTCETLLPDAPVLDAAGVDSLRGEDEFVVGKPDPVINRLGYLNCRYGVTGKDDTPAIEIGVSLYASAHDATSRITATVDDYTAHGASAAEATVDGLAGKMLTGGVGDDYAVPTLVVASGQRTVAVGIADSVASGEKAVDGATALAALALKRTGQ